MPLPENADQAWPPEHLRPVYAKIAEWDAWYSGDPEQLISVYAGKHYQPSGVLARAVRTVKRWVWGNHESSSRPRQRTHHPLAGDLAAASADLLFADPPVFKIEVAEPEAPEADTPDPGAEGEAGDVEDEAIDPTQARLDDLVDEGFHATLLEAADIASGLGGVYLRVCWDKDVDPDKPWIAAVHPDAAVPEFRYGRLWAVTFWRTILAEGNRVVRHLERHEVDRTDPENPKGVIRHGVYDGGPAGIGHLAALADFTQTAAIAESIEYGDAIETGYAGLSAVYVPNRLPNKVFRNLPDATAIGASDYAGVEGMLDMLDLTVSSWGRDIDLGRARLIVPNDYLLNLGRGQGAEFDLDRELYEVINYTGEDKSGVDITQVQFPIRWTEHQESANQFKRDVIASAGYSAATFGLTESGQPVTATEVNADERKSNITTSRKARYWTSALADILEALLAVDVKHFATTGTVPQRPRIEWPPAVAVDPETESRTIVNWHTAEAISLEERVKARKPDWTPKQVQAEVERLKEENKALAPEDPGDFRGGAFGQDDKDEPPEDEGDGDEA
jgi:hypothetical protein